MERGSMRGVAKWLTFWPQREEIVELVGYKISPQINAQLIDVINCLGHTTIFDWSQLILFFSLSLFPRRRRT